MNELKQNIEESESRSESRDTSYTPIGEASLTRSPTPGAAAPVPFSPQDRRGSQLQSVPEANTTAAGPSSAPCHLSWLEREAICDQIGKFLARSISGGFRGASGRDRIPFPSRLWIIVRDFAGQIYTPVKVVRSWTSCKVLCKPCSNECGDSVFVGVPSEREARRVVATAELEWPAVIEQ